MPKAPTTTRTVTVRAIPIELCQLIKFAGLADSGGEAKQLISEGMVLLNGAVETQKRKKLVAGDRVTLRDQTLIVHVA
jgi:ribosome-associated protein